MRKDFLKDQQEQLEKLLQKALDNGNTGTYNNLLKAYTEVCKLLKDDKVYSKENKKEYYLFLALLSKWYVENNNALDVILYHLIIEKGTDKELKDCIDLGDTKSMKNKLNNYIKKYWISVLTNK